MLLSEFIKESVEFLKGDFYSDQFIHFAWKAAIGDLFKILSKEISGLEVNSSEIKKQFANQIAKNLLLLGICVERSGENCEINLLKYNYGSKFQNNYDIYQEFIEYMRFVYERVEVTYDFYDNKKRLVLVEDLLEDYGKIAGLLGLSIVDCLETFLSRKHLYSPESLLLK